MVILDVGLEVIGQVVDARGQQGHLHFGRTGVALGTLVALDDLRSLRNGRGHLAQFSLTWENTRFY